MSRKTDKISTLINAKYFNWIRESILKHGNVNIQALSEKFNILAGNTYFRNFIKDKNQDYLGISGLTSILNTCGYTLRLVPVENTDVTSLKLLDNMTKDAFTNVSNTVGNLAESVKRSPKIIKEKKVKIINNELLINNEIMGANQMEELNDMFNDDDFAIGVVDD